LARGGEGGECWSGDAVDVRQTLTGGEEDLGGSDSVSRLCPALPCPLCPQDLFNIVAVDDFNMGAMENKSLNIFNSRLVLADPDSATDTDYARIEGVVGHEYFHNWTGGCWLATQAGMCWLFVLLLEVGTR
jgi:hypothetical protein